MKENNNDSLNHSEKVNSAPESAAAAEGATGSAPQSSLHAEAFSRIFHSLLLAFFAWVAIWVFALVMLVQWGFLVFTGEINQNLKGFMSEVGQYIARVLRFLAFETEEKPFPFSPWPHQARDSSAQGPGNASANQST